MSIHELQAALRALDEARERDSWKAVADGWYEVEFAARRVAEGVGEPVARLMSYRGRDTYPKRGYTVARTYEECAENAYPESWEEGAKLYTTPPSADALVEALGKLSAEWRSRGRYIRGITAQLVREEIYMAADALDAALAKHKENTDGR